MKICFICNFINAYTFIGDGLLLQYVFAFLVFYVGTLVDSGFCCPLKIAGWKM
jgi:hypothetical protein